MKVLLARLPELIGLSGFTLGVTNLQQTTILNNGGVAAPFLPYIDDLFYTNLNEDLTGVFNVNVYKGVNYIAQGYVNLLATSGYYLVEGPADLSAQSTNSAVVANISAFKGTTWSINVSGIGSVSDNFYFTLKPNKYIVDSDSVLQISRSGMTYLNKQQAINNSGFLTYSVDNGGTINMLVNEDITSQISSIPKYVYDIKGTGSTVSIRSYGTFTVREDVTDRND